MIEAKVSRLYGHSSSSGAQRVRNEADPIELFERKLSEVGLLDHVAIEHTHEEALAEVEAVVEQVLNEAMPTAGRRGEIHHAPSSVDAVYPEDYTGCRRNNKPPRCKDAKKEREKFRNQMK